MFSLFGNKPDVTAKEVGDALFKLFLKSAGESQERTLQLIPKENWERADSELMYLRIIAMDFGVKSALGKSLKTNQILKVFYEHLESVTTLEDMPNKFFMQDLDSRFSAYGHAPDYDNDLPLIAKIGSKFCELCGIQDDPQVADHAGVIFGTTSKVVRDLVGGFKIN